MKKIRLIQCIAVFFILFFSSICFAAPSPPMAKLCANCHDPEQGVMMGFLENIAIKSHTLQMNFLSHKEVVKFDDNTPVKNVKSLQDIRNYLNKGFTINFIEKDGEKYAKEIIRFDILKTIEQGEYKVEKLTKEQFKTQMADKNAVIYDVRPPMLYKEAHIPGAKPMPAPAFDKFKDKLPKDKTTPLLLYGVGGCLSPTVAFSTKSLGYENVSIFTDGFPSWSTTDYSVTTPDWLKDAITKEIPHVLVDLRDKTDVEKNHIRGAVSIPFANLSAEKEKFPKQKNAPIIFYGPNKEKAAEMLVAWGYRAARVLPASFEQWAAGDNPVSTGPAASTIVYVPKAKTGTISIADFEKAADNPSDGTILIDVRSPDEYETMHITGSINIPVDSIGPRKDEIDDSKDIILFCPSGVRAEMAHNILKDNGKKSRYVDAHLSFDEDGSYDIKEK